MFYYNAISILILLTLASCVSTGQKGISKVDQKDARQYNFVLSDAEWKERLTDMEYYVLRQAGTERAFTGDLLDNKQQGYYICAGCNQRLFHSDTKFRSGTGWPSFYDVVSQDSIRLDTDYKIGYERSEVLCGNCGGHLGHVFNDGPAPTGLRYCINSAALDFEAGE